MSELSSQKCQQCAKGKYLADRAEDESKHDNIEDCVVCEIHTYNPFEGQANCHSCPSAASTGVTECTGCDPGKHETTGGCEYFHFFFFILVPFT